MGCIFAEMYLGAPLFRAEDDKGESDEEPDRIKQMAQIFRLLGTPSAATWPVCQCLLCRRLVQ